MLIILTIITYQLRTNNIIITVYNIFFLSFTKSREWSYLLDSNWKRVPEVGASVMKRANTILGSSN